MLCELGRLQQADLQRRRHLVSSVPAHIFQPLYRQDDLRSEQQRELEIAFQDLCTVEKGQRFRYTRLRPYQLFNEYKAHSNTPISSPIQPEIPQEIPKGPGNAAPRNRTRELFALGLSATQSATVSLSSCM